MPAVAGVALQPDRKRLALRLVVEQHQRVVHRAGEHVEIAVIVDVWASLSASGLTFRFHNLRQRIRPRSELPAKMEIRAIWSS